MVSLAHAAVCRRDRRDGLSDPRTGLIYTGETNVSFRTFDPATKVWASVPSNGWGMAFGVGRGP